METKSLYMHKVSLMYKRGWYSHNKYIITEASSKVNFLSTIIT